MKNAKVRCPHCRSVVAPAGRSGRYWCDRCDERVDAPDPDPDPDPPRRRPVNGGLVAVLILVPVVAGVLLVGLAVGVYLLALRPAGPDSTGVTADRVGATLASPKGSNPEEVIRRVKKASVYVRSIQRGGTSTGSGFFVGRPGFVVTNAHVVGYGPGERPEPGRVEVVVGSGEPYERTLPAEVYGVDVPGDLALLRLPGDLALPDPLAFGRAADLAETQEVFIYGYPFGERLGKNISVNRSTVSSLRREEGRLAVVQLAGGLNPGNSGGPVTNARGEVVGVSVAKLRGAETIGFAIPAEAAAEFLAAQHRAGGRFVYDPAAGPAAPPDRLRFPAPGQPAAGQSDDPLPLLLPPVTPVPIPPAAVAAGTEVKLPAAADRVCVGGGGRFLVLSLPAKKQVAVFDVSRAEVVKYLPAPAEKVLVAAGMDKLAVVAPDLGVVERWSLLTFEKEATAPLPVTAGLKATAVAMGAGSSGPLLVQAMDWPRLGEWFVFDVTAMKEAAGGAGRHRLECRPGDRVLASDNGRTFVVNRASGTASLLAMVGPRWGEGRTPWKLSGLVAPSADGTTVYGAGDLCTVEGERIGQPTGRDRYYVPAASGPLVLAVTDTSGGDRREFALAVHTARDPEPLFRLPPMPALGSLFERKTEWASTGRIFFVPPAGVVAVLPPAADRLVLYPADVAAGLAAADRGYLFVASQPPPSAVPGGRFEYRLDVRSKGGGVRYNMALRPPGMSLTADGVVRWDVPADFARPVKVVVTVTDKSELRAFHTLELDPAARMK